MHHNEIDNYISRAYAQGACAIPSCVSMWEAAASVKPAVIFHPVQLLSIRFGHPVNPKLQVQVFASFHLQKQVFF
jgi:hypothetical protein